MASGAWPMAGQSSFRARRQAFSSSRRTSGSMPALPARGSAGSSSPGPGAPNPVAPTMSKMGAAAASFSTSTPVPSTPREGPLQATRSAASRVSKRPIPISNPPNPRGTTGRASPSRWIRLDRVPDSTGSATRTTSSPCIGARSPMSGSMRHGKWSPRGPRIGRRRSRTSCFDSAATTGCTSCFEDR
jgi:hypothetical protein